MRLIDADALKQNMLITTAGTGYQSMVLAEIDDAPTVDAYEEGYKMGKFHAREEIERCVRDLLAIYGGNK